MLIEGMVEEIIFRNEGNGYTVFVFEHEDYHTVCVGKFLNISEGEHFKLDGNYATNSKYGEQFAVSSYESIYPTTLAGIKKYLSSGLIKGVGPVTANNIVDKFKQDTLNIIEFAPKELEKVKGISKNKAEAIGEAFREIKHLQNTLIFLQSYGLTLNMAMKIYEVYQNNTIELVKENPYRLVEDVDGIGFLSADKIAKSLGINHESEFRVRAGILHVLGEASEKNGHTYLPKNELLEIVGNLLDIEKNELFEKVLSDLLLDKVVVKNYIPPHEAIALTKLFFYEKNVADIKKNAIKADSQILHYENGDVVMDFGKWFSADEHKYYGRYIGLDYIPNDAEKLKDTLKSVRSERSNYPVGNIETHIDDLIKSAVANRIISMTDKEKSDHIELIHYRLDYGDTRNITTFDYALYDALIHAKKPSIKKQLADNAAKDGGVPAKKTKNKNNDLEV